MSSGRNSAARGKPAVCSSRMDLEGTVLTEMSRTLPSGGFWKGQTSVKESRRLGVGVRAGRGGRELAVVPG